MANKYFISKYDKHKKKLKQTKNSDKIVEELYLSDVIEIKAKLKQKRKKLKQDNK